MPETDGNASEFWWEILQEKTPLGISKRRENNKIRIYLK
jgi:hypothetical protein